MTERTESGSSAGDGGLAESGGARTGSAAGGAA
jgi:hypothetical protein